jgi:predicted anti-sigma-YlaC factor YlaD
MTRCPSEDELVRFIDADLSPEDSSRVSEHLGRCQSCGRQVRELRLLVEDLSATHTVELDVYAHVKDVMRRLERPSAREKRPAVMVRIAAIAAIAASAGLVAHVVGQRHGSTSGTWQARGSSSGESLSRDVGLQVYVLKESLQPLRPGDTIAPDAALTAGLRNLGHSTAHVLLFAVDSRNAVHWITPKYTRSDENPAATELTKTSRERRLPTSVVFEDVAPGPMRIVTIVSPSPMRVSQVEGLPESELAHGNLAQRFANAEVREIIVQVKLANRNGVQ